MYVLHVPTTVDARTYAEEEKLPAAVSTYLMLYVRTYCTYLVLAYLQTYVRPYCTYCCSYKCTYVPTVRTALIPKVHAFRTKLLYLLHVQLNHDNERFHLLLYVLSVHTSCTC